MSNSDLWMRDVIVSYGIVLLLPVGLLIWIIQRWSKFREKSYRNYLLGFETECAELAEPYKRRLFESLEHTVSKDELLRSMNCIRVLEIGVKTGENIQFYPKGTHLIVVDTNLHLGRYLVQGRFSHVILEHLIVGDGSCLKDVPSGSVDVAVSTRSMCSVKSMPATLREIRRVLAPDGRYLFMEHIPESKGTFVRWLQVALSRSGLWPSLFGGCRLDADFEAEMKKTEFREIGWTHVTLEGYVSQPFHMMLSKQHVFGIATR